MKAAAVLMTVLVLLAVACSKPTPTPTVTATRSPTPTPTAIPTALTPLAQVTRRPLTPTPTPTQAPGTFTAWDADTVVVEYIFSSAITAYGKRVAAETVDKWYHGPFEKQPDGSWKGIVYLQPETVEGNTLMKPIFKEAKRYCRAADQSREYMVTTSQPCPAGEVDQGMKYPTEWRVTSDKKVVALDGNALRLSAAFIASSPP